MIEIKNITKSYHKTKALEDFSFESKSPEIIGLVGPNGAGKSTVMNIISGYIAPDTGSVKIMDALMEENAVKAKGYIGYLPEVPPLYFDMTVLEYLTFVFELRKIPYDKKADKKAHIKEIMDKLRVDDVREKLISSLSKGYRQRVGIAGAVLGYPKIIILDEPTAGLDPKQVTQVRDLILELGKNSTILISSHILSEIEAICSRVLMLKKGRLISDGSKSKTKASKESVIFISIKMDKKKIANALGKIKEISKYEIIREDDETDILVCVKGKQDIRGKLSGTLIQEGAQVLEIRKREDTLEEAFLKLMGEQEEEN